MRMIPKELLPRPNLPFFGSAGLFALSRWGLRFLRDFDYRETSAASPTSPATSVRFKYVAFDAHQSAQFSRSADTKDQFPPPPSCPMF